MSSPRALAAFAVTLAATALPLKAWQLRRVLRLAGTSVGVSLAVAVAAAIALVWSARRLQRVAPFALIAATLLAGPLFANARVIAPLRSLTQSAFLAAAEVSAELHAASSVAAAFAAALAAALVVGRRDDAMGRLVASSLLVASFARALTAGVTAITLDVTNAADFDAAARRLTVAAFLGWAGALLGALGLCLAWIRARQTGQRDGQTTSVVALLAIVAALAVDAAAFRAWGTLGRPDLTDGVRLPLRSGPPAMMFDLGWDLAVTRDGVVVLPDGRCFPLTTPSLALHLRGRFSPDLPADTSTEGGDMLCAGKVIAMNALSVVADGALRRPALEALVAAAEDASISRLTLLFRTDTRPGVGRWGPARLLPPSVSGVTLHLAPTRRSCPRTIGRDRVDRLPDLSLDAFIRNVAGQRRAYNALGVLFTADPALVEAP